MMSELESNYAIDPDEKILDPEKELKERKKLILNDFPNFEEILEKRVANKKEEIPEEQEKQDDEEDRKRLFEIERKQFRKSNFENVIQDCIDYVVGSVGTMTSNDVYTTVIILNEGNRERFFSIEDIEVILDGLVRNNLLGGFGEFDGEFDEYIYAPLVNALTISELVDKKYEEIEEQKTYWKIEEVNAKNVRKSKIEKLVKDCIDYFCPCQDGEVIDQISFKTLDDVYEAIILKNELERFFTKEDLEEILQGLVQNGFLKYGRKTVSNVTNRSNRFNYHPNVSILYGRDYRANTHQNTDSHYTYSYVPRRL